MYQGPVRFTAVNEHQQSVAMIEPGDPTPWSPEPVIWMMVTRPDAHGNGAYVFIPFESVEPYAVRFEQAFLTLQDILDHPELYVDA